MVVHLPQFADPGEGAFWANTPAAHEIDENFCFFLEYNEHLAFIRKRLF